MTKSSLEAAAIVEARIAPAATSLFTPPWLRLYTVRLFPACNKFWAIGNPIRPSAMKPTFIIKTLSVTGHSYRCVARIETDFDRNNLSLIASWFARATN